MMRLIRTVGSVAIVLLLALPAAAQGPADHPGMHEQGMGEQEHGSGHHGHGPRHHGWGRPLVTIMLHHRQDLGLAPEQVEKLERLRGDFMRDAIRRQADVKIARLDLADLLRPDSADPAKAVDLAKVDTKIHELAQLKADFHVARLRTIEAGKAVLTPEQHAKLAAPPRPAPPARSRRRPPHAAAAVAARPTIAPGPRPAS